MNTVKYLKNLSAKVLPFFGVLLLSSGVFAESSFLDLSARFKTEEIQGSESRSVGSWTLWRKPGLVEVLNQHSQRGNRWILSRSGSLTYQDISHKHRFKILYQTSDFKSLEMKPVWWQKNTLLKKEWLQKFKKKSRAHYKGLVTEEYEGRVGNTAIRFVWLPSLQIPLEFEERKKDRTLRHRLVEHHELNVSPWSWPESEDYDDMDFSDLGDNESHQIAHQMMDEAGVGHKH
ncbi:hypothetical protein [Pseudoteredinibacter isoporae]|uniref:DUF3108 domain-containing protein n=1 Tax=Pseudoteredinibacter isoporae TaxID=570281 RepID=A0A7X0JTQ9_9GAMM|nr:hypothetical protein [Pseudoteredinibacter isoporae]MBB6521231.1 hypothetical protein [Pseudoteredinibacter isoporae]NHO86789.1 hypothetical protein [Pseudoteredinibacter isoporae]NIB24759.1 hypothetical protein [Pseudoteredinibacter isoporae]